MTPTVPPHLEALTRRCQKLFSVLSPNEIETLKVVGQKRLTAEIARLKPEAEKAQALRDQIERLKKEIEWQKWLSEQLARREKAKLTNHTFNSYCRPEILPGKTIPHICWPRYLFLGGVTTNVIDYLRFKGERVWRPRPAWKAFKLLDRRLPSLQLAAQVDELAKRANNLLTENRSLARDARPLVLWLSIIGHPSARKLAAFDPATQVVVKSLKKQMADEKVQSKREAARQRKRQQRARCRIDVTRTVVRPKESF